MSWLQSGEAQMRGLPPGTDNAAVPVAALFAFAGMEGAEGAAGQVAEANPTLAGSEGVVSEDYGPGSVATSQSGS